MSHVGGNVSPMWGEEDVVCAQDVSCVRETHVSHVEGPHVSHEEAHMSH